MFSQQSDFQMPRTIPNYQLHQQNPFQQQIQVFQQHFQAFQQQHQHQQQHHPHPQQFQQQSQQLLPHNLHPTPSPSLSSSPPRPHSQSPPHQQGSSSSRRSSRGRSKRVRTIFTPEQLKRLEQEFSIQMYLVGPDRGLLANSLGLTEAQVKVWFQNRRIKFRKLSSESPPPTVNGQSNMTNNHVKLDVNTDT